MVFKFYKTEKVLLPDGNEFEIVPVTVEDMPLVLEIVNLRKTLKLDEVSRKKMDKDEMAELNIKEFFPRVMKIAQRGVKRTMDDYMGMTAEELDKTPDIPMSINVAIRISTAMIEISVGEDDEIKKFLDKGEQQLSPKQKKKS